MCERRPAQRDHEDADHRVATLDQVRAAKGVAIEASNTRDIVSAGSASR